MTFADKTDKASTGRFTLVRVTPARCIDSYLASVGGGVYQMTWTRPVAALTRNGTALTQVGALSAVDQFTYDETTQILQVQLASAPSDSTNVLVLFFYLFYTSGMAVLANQDPLDTSTPLRQWTPRLLSEPLLSQTVRNLTQGVFTVADTSVELANVDRSLNQWLGSTDSFKGKDVDCWLGIRAGNSQSPAFQRIFKGKVSAVILTAESVELQIYDAFSRLSQPAFMGDTPAEAYLQAVSGSYPNVNPSDAGKAVPFFVGKWSRYQTKNDGQYAGGSIYQALDPSAMPEAVCTSFNAVASTSNNRTWTLGRCPSEAFRSWSAPAILSTIAGSGGSSVPYAMFFNVDPSALASADIAVGDRVMLTDGTNGSHKARICQCDSGTLGVIFNSQTAFTYGAGTTITTYSDPVLVLVDENGKVYYLTPGVDYTTSTGATSGGNLLVQIVFGTNFEAGLVPANGFPATFPGPLDPTRHKVYFRLRLAASNYARHGDVLSQMMTLAGLSVNAATFAAANAALPINCAFSVPYFDEADYKSYLDYSEDILASTLGIVALDSSAQVQYALIAAPSASDGTDDNYVLGDQSLQIAVDYNDVVTGLIAYNPHNSSQAAIQGTPSPSETRYNLLAQYLHGISNAVQFRHVLETITGRIDQLLAARSNRRATYTFGVATRYLTAKIGDDCQLQTKFLLGSDTARSVKITSLDKSADRVTVSAIDLLGVT